MRETYFYLLVITFMLLSSNNTGIHPIIGQEQYAVLNTAIVESEPIILRNNDEAGWTDFKGDGSEDNPYLIQNLFFNSTNSYFRSAIYLESITHHVVIQNCVFDAITGFAIQLQESSNIIITNNTFIHSARGLTIYGGHNFFVTENTFIDRQVISLFKDSNIAIINNSLHGDVWANEVSSCIVTSNVITEGSISVDTSDNFDISFNDLSDCNISIIFHGLRDSLISQNHIENSRYVGIAIYGIKTVNNSVHKNTLIGGEISDYGIRVDESASGNIIDWNNLINHTVNAYCTSENNTFDYNYYSDYSGTDANGDLIGDSPYDVTGDAYLMDIHPRMTTEMFVNTPTTSLLDTSAASIPEEVILVVGVSVVILVLLIAVVIIKRR